MTDLALSEERQIELLGAIAAADGSTRIAARRLKQRGDEVPERELKDLLEQHPGMYQALAVERSGAQEEALAQGFREQVKLAQGITKAFLEELAVYIEDGGIDSIPHEYKRQMPQIMQAPGKPAQAGADKLLALTGRPTDGSAAAPLAAAKWLVDNGILKPVERPAIDSTAEEA